MEKTEGRSKLYFNYLQLLIGVAAFFVVYFLFESENDLEQARLTAAVAALIAVWWITEAIPLAATSLLPLFLFPLLGILSGRETASAYVNSTIFLFFGGFLIAIAMEKWQLHKRVSLNVISLVGTNPSKIVLGFMLASAFLSMWISNTATAVMLLPIGLAIIKKLERDFDDKNIKKFSLALLLGIAYACSIGGIGTLIGTPPNLVFKRVYSISFPDKPEILFSEWMIFAIPISLIMLFAVWFLLTKVFFKPSDKLIIDKSIIDREKKELGKISFEEKSVTAVLSAAAFFWIFRKKIETGIFTLPGWSDLFPNPDLIDDGTVAVFFAFLLFVIPARNSNGEKFLLSTKDFRSVPWEIILLFGGGFALAQGFVSSGLSRIIGEQFAYLKGINVYLIILIICLSITFLTELTSNTATAQIILPILASMALQLEIDPKLIMIPATLSASMAFMMPVATPPNAIIFGSGKIRVVEMARVGVFLNLIGAIVISVFVYLFFG